MTTDNANANANANRIQTMTTATTYDPTTPPHLDADNPANYATAEEIVQYEMMRDLYGAQPIREVKRPAKPAPELPLPTMDDDGRVLYFAYGSNLDQDQMEDRCPGAELVYAATMDGYRIAFTGHSMTRRGAVATIVKRKGCKVEGLVYSLTADDVRALDRCEGAPHVYRRLEIEMDDDDGAHPCIVYVHRETKERPPGRDYYRQIRRAYDDQGFDVAPLHKAIERFAPPRKRNRNRPARKLAAVPDVPRGAPDKGTDAPQRRRTNANAGVTTKAHPHLVFVYGTLMYGFGNNRMLQGDGAEFLGEDTTRPEFHMVDLGPFPGILRGGQTEITGEIYRVNDATLCRLDRLEGVPTLYTRQRARLASGLLVNVYVLGHKRARGCARVASGDWRAHRAGGSA
jgi:gamma-glutamylcyclotransferase (GGCT)/AIG2-like uncharacterized protein YtfP